MTEPHVATAPEPQTWSGLDARPVVAVVVGTDHHPFDRLVRWSDALARERPDIEVRVQYGTARPPERATGVRIWSKEQLGQVVRDAHIVVSHGGPGTISDVRAGGTLPIVVARDPAHGEHVDGHQLRFVARMSASGLVDEVNDEQHLLDQVSRRLGEPRGCGLSEVLDHNRVQSTCDRFAAVVASLPESRRRRR